MQQRRPPITLEGMKRETNQTIWRTVVFAGAMLAVPACSKPKPAATTPTNTATAPADKKPGDTATTATPDPNAPPANPCGDDGMSGRPRGTDDDGGGGTGRGFVLS